MLAATGAKYFFFSCLPAGPMFELPNVAVALRVSANAGGDCMLVADVAGASIVAVGGM